MTRADIVGYDKKTFFAAFAGIAVLCLAMKATGGAGFVLLYGLILSGLSGNKASSLFYALLVTTVLTMTNSFFAPKDFVYSIANRLVYVSVGTVTFFQIVGQRGNKLFTPLLSLLVYIFYMALVSSVGWSPIISYLKLLLFLIVFFALYSVSCRMAAQRYNQESVIRSFLLVFASFFLVGSVLLIPFPGISKFGAAAALAMGLPVEAVGLYQGITLQPQVLGPVVAMMNTVLLADMLFSLRRLNKVYLFLLFCAPILVFYTSSRTAMGTYLFGIAFVTFLFLHARGVSGRWRQKMLSLMTLFVALVGIALFATPQMREKVISFVYKTGDSVLVEEERGFDRFVASRQGLMDSAMDHFYDSPWIGNGFQVSSNMAAQDIVSWKQLLSAPVEKGVWVTAVLEEGGIFGMALFVLFILVTFFQLMARRAYIGLSAFGILIVSNLGEFTFFSMSGVGGLMWAFLFMGLVLDAYRIKIQNTFAKRFI